MSKASPCFFVDTHPEFQRGLDFRRVAELGYSAAFVKCTQGGRYAPAGFREYFNRAKASGLLVGAYHFLDSTASGTAQARHFLRTLETAGGPDGKLLAVDFEHYDGGSPGNQHLSDFIAEFKRLTNGHPIIVYTNKGFWEGGDSSGPFARYGADALWVARYADMAKHDRPRDHYQEIKDWSGAWESVGGKSADMYQFTSTGLVAGQHIDVNAFDGSRADLVALTGKQASAPVQPPKPSTGGSVPKPKWQENWETARTYMRRCAAADILYWFWDGGMLNRTVAGRPASKDGPMPAFDTIKRGFCADLLSWGLRAAGLPIPKNRGAGWNYDGGTQAFWLAYRDVMVPFRLSEMRDGDVAYRRFVDGVDEGHIMADDEGRALQSFAQDNLGNPGPDRRYTVAESHDGGYYQYRIPREKFWV